VGSQILVVEDDPTSRVLLARMLIEMGHDVTSAATADEALRYLYTDEPYDLVLTDIVMPGMSGIELAQRTNDARPGLPLILVTGIPGALDRALNADTIVLPKPITRNRLARIIDEALEN
jgi:two-component system cell cycle response regulator CpdR